MPKKKTDISHSIGTVPGLDNRSYLVVNNQDTGAKALEWLRGVLPGSGVAFTYDELTALAATAPRGSGDVTFTPWLAGERSPVADRRARGKLHQRLASHRHCGSRTGRPRGGSRQQNWLFGHVERFRGAASPPSALLAGGARSSLWCQIFADALNRPVEQVPEPMFVQLRGSASLSSVALGRRTLAQIQTDRAEGSVFTPDADGVATMAHVTSELVSLYKDNKARFRRLNH